MAQGTKEGPEIGTVQVLTQESNTKDVVVILPRMPQTSKVTFECEVSGLKGRHGRQDRFYEKKMVFMIIL